MTNFAKELSKAFATVSEIVPGSACRCTWERADTIAYDVETGAPKASSKNVLFSAIRSTFKREQLLEGILAGDFPLYVEAMDVPDCPRAGDIIHIDGRKFSVVNSLNDSTLLYTLQMREL